MSLKTNRKGAVEAFVAIIKGSQPVITPEFVSKVLGWNRWTVFVAQAPRSPPFGTLSPRFLRARIRLSCFIGTYPAGRADHLILFHQNKSKTNRNGTSGPLPALSPLSDQHRRARASSRPVVGLTRVLFTECRHCRATAPFKALRGAVVDNNLVPWDAPSAHGRVADPSLVSSSSPPPMPRKTP